MEVSGNNIFAGEFVENKRGSFKAFISVGSLADFINQDNGRRSVIGNDFTEMFDMLRKG